MIKYLLIYFLNKVQVGNTDNDAEKLLQTRLISESAEIYPKDALQMCAEKEPGIKRNEVVLNYLTGELYTIEVMIKF